MSIVNWELFPPNYNVIRSERKFSNVNRSRGDGVLIAVDNSIIYHISDTSNLTLPVPLIDIIIVKCFFEPCYVLFDGVYTVMSVRS